MDYFAFFLTPGALLIFLLASPYGNSSTETAVPENRKDVRTVFVAHDNWHSAILLRKSDIPTRLVPEIKDSPDAELIEFSWGDKDYFPAEKGGVRLALKAAFFSSGSVLHVVGYQGQVEKIFPEAEIIEISLSEKGLERLIKFISDTFSRPQPGAAAEGRKGFPPTGWFYPAEGKFSILRTCNTWVAEALNAAGLPINPSGIITAASLGNHVRPFGTVINAQ